MENFKEGLKVVRDRHGKITITESLKMLLIELMKGNISKPELMARTGIGDKTTVELKIKEIVAQSPELMPLYEEYLARKRENFMGYQFRAEAIEMLRKDLSQSAMAKRIGVSRRSFSFRIKELQKNNAGNSLGRLLQEHSERKLRKKQLTKEDVITINLELDEYEEQFPVGLARYEKRNPLEVRRENFQRIVSLVEMLRKEGISLSELSRRNVISEAEYRRAKEELEVLDRLFGRDR